MRYLKWFYLATWVLIYQLPSRTAIAFSTLIIAVATFLFLWLFVSPNFIVGLINEVHALPGNQNVVISVGLPDRVFSKMAVLDVLEAPVDAEEVLWFLGYGKIHQTFNGKSILLLGAHTTLSRTTLMDLAGRVQLSDFLKTIPRSGLIGGILLVVFGMLALQMMTAAMIGFITLVASWHLLYVGNYHDLWLLSDFMIYSSCIAAGVIGSALGMRTNFGWSAAIFHRISAAVLLLMFFPLLINQITVMDSVLVSTIGIFLTCLFPCIGYIASGGALISNSLDLNQAESVVIVLLCLGVALWMRHHQHLQQHSHILFKNCQEMENVEKEYYTP